MNDPTEGSLLQQILDKRYPLEAIKPREQEDVCFIKSFTFNFNSLNQFRLYGKTNNVEASGLSLVFNENFFEDKITDYKDNSKLLENFVSEKGNPITVKNSKKKETGKLPLYRCIYLEPESLYQENPEKWVLELAHVDQSSFMADGDKTTDDYNNYLEQVEKDKKEIITLLKVI